MVRYSFEILGLEIFGLVTLCSYGKTPEREVFFVLFFFTEIVRTCVLTDNLDRRYFTVILNKNSSFRQLNRIYITPPPPKKNIANKSKTKQKRMAMRKHNTFF